MKLQDYKGVQSWKPCCQYFTVKLQRSCNLDYGIENVKLRYTAGNPAASILPLIYREVVI